MEKRLGKGLDALIPVVDTGNPKEKIEKLRITEIRPSKFQPRKTFDSNKMSELVESIRAKGVIQPVLVRPSMSGGYELIAGERRLRAAQELAMEEIPAIIKRDISDADSLELSLIENIQRAELNPVEEARAYQELIDRFEYTLDKVGQMVGKDKTTVSNSLRLLTLQQDILKYIEEGKITMGHAKALLSLSGEQKRKKLAMIVVRRGISVRETEEFARRIEEPKARARKQKDPELARIEEELQHKFGTRVNILQGKKRGRIEIQYFSNEDLQRLLRLLLPETGDM
jgi:ParB family chromosome partitioning protein